MTVIIFILILTVLVLIHELGHFLVAKKLGIKVEEFGFGFPPRAFGIKKGETIYSINWLPIGGFVKLYGEDEAGGGKLKVESGKLKVTDKGRAFFARPVWQRGLVVIAGVAMNFVLAVAVISYLFASQGVAVVGNEVVVLATSPNSPAQKAGLKTGDIIVSINGEKIGKTRELTEITQKNSGEKVILEVKNKPSSRAQAEVRKIEIVPRKNYPKNEGPMGVSISQNVEVKKYPWYQAPFLGTGEALKMSWMIVSSLAISLWQFITMGAAPKGLAGPVGIAQITGQFVQIGPLAVLSFISLLSLNLAVLNILPIPALDGGRLFFILVEGVTGRRVPQKFEGYAHAVGMAILLALIALITFRDVSRLLSGQPILPTP